MPIAEWTNTSPLLERGRPVLAAHLRYIYYSLLHTLSMPIDIDQFEGAPEADLRAGGPTNAEVILDFLAANPEQAFTPKEIHERTDVARGSVGVVLSRLHEEDLVRHRGEYWAIADVEDIDVSLTSMAATRAANDSLGPEDREEWGPGVDEREDE